MEPFQKRETWNKGMLIGQKPLLKPKDISAIRIHLQNVQTNLRVHQHPRISYTLNPIWEEQKSHF